MSVPAQNFNAATIDIIRKQCAPDTNDVEFNYFMKMAESLGLNPLSRQIMAQVYSKNDPKKRRVTIITEIGGLRAIAARAGDYRPDDEDPVYTYGMPKDPTNPLGIEKCSVNAWKQDSKGNWNKVRGTVYWDEFRKIRYWDGKPQLDGNWKTMPRHMIAKCAEAHALRKGWPEQVSGIYEFAESDNFDEDMLPTQKVEEAQSEQRAKRVGWEPGEYAFVMIEGDPIMNVAPGKVHDLIEAHYRNLDSIIDIKNFEFRNSSSLQRFWAADPDAALNLKAISERRQAEIVAEAEKETA